MHRAARGFLHWYHHHYRPPCLHGKTPAPLCHDHPGLRLTPDVQRQLPDFPTAPLPLTAGRIHFMRKDDSAGYVEILNERWRVGPHWSGEYVRATINTAQQSLTFWHKADENAHWRNLKTRIFYLQESIHDLLPQFKRNRARCRDYLPG